MPNRSESSASAQPPDPSLFPGMRSPPDRAPRQNVYCRSCALTASQPGAPAPSAPAPERAFHSLLLIPTGHIRGTGHARVPSLCQAGLRGSGGACSPQPHTPTVPGVQNRSGTRGGWTAGTASSNLLRCPAHILTGCPGRRGSYCPLAHLLPVTLLASTVPGRRPGSHSHPPIPSQAKTPREGREKMQVCFLKALGKNVALHGARPKPTGLGSTAQPRAREPRQLLQDVG